MNRTTEHNAVNRESGFVMVAMFALILALLGTGAAFMQWATDETYQGERAFANMQAYYCAQTGLIERGLTWFSQQQEGLLPSAGVTLSGGTVPDVGTYGSVTVTPVFGATGEGDNFSFSNIYSITSVGKVKIPWEGNDYVEVERKAVMYVQVRSYVDYMYLTDNETSLTFPGDIIRFFGGDTLWGRTHSNDWIATQNAHGGIPVAYDIVSTSKPGFRQGSPNPAFNFLGGDPLFDYPEVLLPELANPLRECSLTQHFEQVGQEWRLSIRGSSAYLFNWEEGAEFDSSHFVVLSLNPVASIFVHGRLEVEGVIAAEGCKLTIGCSDNIWLINDVMIEGTNRATGALPAGATSVIGIVSERWIYIDNTTANGRENCTNGDHSNNNHARCHIVLTCALVALGESFQFHQMNDVTDPYIGPTPDERGNIVMTGSITQRWRGYVHRSNNTGTGYNKVYHYDNRFLRSRPPCFLGATDEDGRVLYNIVQWGQASEDPVSVAHKQRVRYN